MTTTKIESFKYVMKRLGEWKLEACQLSSFSITQELKLLFFVSAIRVNGRDLLDIFDNFYAMQFGPVESDVFDSLSKNEIFISDSQLSSETIDRIDSSIKELRNVAPSIITMSASQLVDITHKWTCWRDSFRFAEFLGKGSVKMGRNRFVNQINSLRNEWV